MFEAPKQSCVGCRLRRRKAYEFHVVLLHETEEAEVEDVAALAIEEQKVGPGVIFWELSHKHFPQSMNTSAVPDALTDRFSRVSFIHSFLTLIPLKMISGGANALLIFSAASVVEAVSSSVVI